MSSVASADISKLAEALRQASHESQVTTQQVLVQSANHILAEMEAKVPVKTGRLKGSLSIRISSDKVIIGPNESVAPYAGYVEFGTKPHTIRPRKPGGVLTFMVGSTRVYTKVVHHPGTTAQPYVKPAFEAWMDSLGTMAAEANAKVITSNGP